MFVEEFKRTPDIAWIMKPVGLSQGKGIFLITKLSQIMDWKKDVRFDERTRERERERDKAKAEGKAADDKEKEPGEVDPYVVQRYVANPYLVGGKKFDLRIYCMVTNWRPLRAYLYRSAFARFSGVPFSMDATDITNTVIHLTNVAVQKTAEGYDPKKGCKWQMFQLRRYMYSRHEAHKVDTLFERIDNIILTTLQVRSYA